MYGFIGAMQVEVEGLTALLEGKEEHKIGAFNFFTGELCGKEVVIVKSGIGKTAAATCAATMALSFKPKCIINTGVAGGISKEVHLKPLDIVVATKVAHHDVDVTALGYEMGVMPGEEMFFECDGDIIKKICRAAEKLDTHVYKGIISSGDQFISCTHTSADIANRQNAYAVDMESATIGHACKLLGVPFGIIRALSDCADEEADITYKELEQIAAGYAIELVQEFLSID